AISALIARTSVQADHKHHNAHELIKDKLKTDGKHELHKHGEHTAHAHVEKGKIKTVTVIHKNKGAVKVTKYKSEKKHHALANPSNEIHHYVVTEEEAQFVTVFVGFGFSDGVH